MDMFDEDLKNVMGGLYQEKSPRKPKFLGQKSAVNWYKRLEGCAKWALICGSISMLLWWFYVNGMMDLEAAYPCIVVCALLAGFGVGKNIVK